jgi:hypothetical protein
MGFLSKILAFAVLAYAIWAMASRIYRSLGGGGQPKPPAPAPDRRETAAAPPKPRRPVVEETRLCAACGSYVSAGAVKCGRPDCPQPA